MSADSCICCGAADIQDHFAGLRRCARCTHIWADMRLSDEDLRELYASTYYQGEEYLDYEMEAPALRRNFRRNLALLEARHPKSARLWEIGVAYGNFLEEAARHFEVGGCDISEFAISCARKKLGDRVQAADYLALPCEHPFDAICLWDTVEHLREPQLYLEKAARELTPGGTLALSTGDIGSFFARLRGPKWRLIHPPTHLHYFSTKSMRTLLERLGLVDIRILQLPFWRSADAVAYRLLAHPEGKWTAPAYRALKRSGALGFSFPVNTYDLMTVYATKPDTSR